MDHFDLSQYPEGMCCKEHGPTKHAHLCKSCMGRDLRFICLLCSPLVVLSLVFGPREEPQQQGTLWEQLLRLAQ